MKSRNRSFLEGVAQGEKARRLYEWFEGLQKRALALGIVLQPITPSELRLFS